MRLTAALGLFFHNLILFETGLCFRGFQSKVTFTKSTDMKLHIVELFRFKYSIFTTNTYLLIPFNKVRSSCNTKYCNPYQPVQVVFYRYSDFLHSFLCVCVSARVFVCGKERER